MDERVKVDPSELTFRNYEGDEDLKIIIGMIEKELSEPYPILTYRYFVQNWPDLTLLCYHGEECIGCIVNKLDFKPNKKGNPEDFRFDEDSIS